MPRPWGTTCSAVCWPVGAKKSARSSTTHFARWVLLPPTPDEAGRAIGERHLMAFETNFDGELQDHVADLRVALGPMLDDAFAWVEGYPGCDNLADLSDFFRRA